MTLQIGLMVHMTVWSANQGSLRPGSAEECVCSAGDVCVGIAAGDGTTQAIFWPSPAVNGSDTHQTPYSYFCAASPPPPPSAARVGQVTLRFGLVLHSLGIESKFSVKAYKLLWDRPLSASLPFPIITLSAPSQLHTSLQLSSFAPLSA